jgi:hypothetical protein
VAKAGRWVQGEIQRWIFDNVIAKWTSVERFAHRAQAGDTAALDRGVARLLSLFTGYNATADVVQAAAGAAGLSLSHLVSLPATSRSLRASLHLLVALFIRIRFPTLIVFNKADSRGARKRLAFLRQLWPRETIFATSALAETKYMLSKPAGCVDLPPELTPLSAITGEAGTGVQVVLDAAVAVRRPLIVFLVLSLSTLDEVEGSPFVMRRGSSVNDVYVSACHGRSLAGDFMRAEALVGSTTRVLKRDSLLAPLGNPIIMRIATSKRAPWQVKH